MPSSPTSHTRWADAGVYLIHGGSRAGTGGRQGKTERATEWLMLTSGTSGVPKIVATPLKR